MKRLPFILASAFVTLSAGAQYWHEGDIKWLNGTEFAKNVETWNKDFRLNEDDNFFISRVKPRLRFQNQATQVKPDLKWDVNDKRLCAWIPTNTNREGNKNALPTGQFDSECFTMWSYVDHWGNWNSPLGAIPGSLTDVAHKNGVVVSSVASVPYGNITAEWRNALDKIGKLDATLTAKFLVYFGSDGIGYNSEFRGYNNTPALQQLHEKLTSEINRLYGNVVSGYNLAENLWYDGTDTTGISFDKGLGSHNIDNWGRKGAERASLFFNYNWNRTTLLNQSISNAASLGNGRNPLWLYCGVNMQGGEPGDTSWPLLEGRNLSIGLWGAHSENLFWQYRGEAGSTPDAKQQRYQHRVENWFTGGSHNPVTCPQPESITTCKGDDKDFHGMAYFMSARSSMGWDLSDEPFYSFFNVGNGRFLNWKGERCNDNEWYNLGVQDYMPTWRWWFTDKYLGKSKSDVPSGGLSASFTWDDAYIGGSCLRVTGSANEEYLHLFKTRYRLQAGDEITFRHKLVGGRGNLSVVLGTEGNESKIAKEIPACSSSDLYDDETWVKKSYTVAQGDGLAGNTLAIVALKFTGADDIDVYVGEFSIKRGSYAPPVKPSAPEVKILRNTYAGIDAKIIFNVPNDKAPGEVCYNDDVNTSLFKIWAQEENGSQTLVGLTTSWAAMSYATPFKGDANGVGKIRFGVSAVALDTDTDSEIAWSEYMESGEHLYSDEITIDKTTITPGEDFTVKAVDDIREFKWTIYKTGESSSPVAESSGFSNEWPCNGLDKTGVYDLQVTKPDGESITHSRYIMITDAARGRLPKIGTLTANGREADIEVIQGKDIEFAYTGRPADGTTSRGIAIEEQFFGVRASEVLSDANQSFSIAGWLKINEFPGAVNFIDIVERDGIWPRNNWGWLWSSLNEDGTMQNYDQDYSRLASGATTNILRYNFGNGEIMFNKGQWTHFAMVFDRNATQTRTLLYINGKKVESTWQYFKSSDYGSGEVLLSSGTTDQYTTANKAMSLKNMIIIGGTRHSGRGHGGNGLTGVLDEFQIWDKAMSADDVKQSMEGLDPDNLPTGLAGYWDFESDPDASNMLAAKGSRKGAKAGYFKLSSSEGTEGQSAFDYLAPRFLSGCPLIEGSDYKITTTPSWKARLGEVRESLGTDLEGKAKIRFYRTGDSYTATLTLTNDLGSDSRSFQFIKVLEDAGVDRIETDDLLTYTIDDTLFLEIGRDGLYDVSVYTLDGHRVAAASDSVNAGDYIKLTLAGEGVHVVDVRRDGRKVKSFKILKK